MYLDVCIICKYYLASAIFSLMLDCIKACAIYEASHRGFWMSISCMDYLELCLSQNISIANGLAVITAARWLLTPLSVLHFSEGEACACALSRIVSKCVILLLRSQAGFLPWGNDNNNNGAHDHSSETPFPPPALPALPPHTPRCSADTPPPAVIGEPGLA